MIYLLFIFAKHEKQEEFVKIMADEIDMVTCGKEIKYYFGDESVLYAFESIEKFDDLSLFFQTILGCSGVVFFLQPYEPDKMSYWLPTDINKHLFDVDNPNEQKNLDNNVDLHKFISGKIENDGHKIAEIDFGMFDDEDDDIIKLKNKKRLPTLNELLDKINERGIKSLTNSEIKLLNNYSK